MIGTSGWFSSTTTLSMPRLRSAGSRCSTVSTDALSGHEAGLQLLPAAEVRDVRGNLDAAEVRALEANAVVGRRRLQRQRHLLAGMEADSGAVDRSTKGALQRHHHVPLARSKQAAANLQCAATLACNAIICVVNLDG